MQGVTGLAVISSHTQNVCSIKEGVPGTEVSLHKLRRLGAWRHRAHCQSGCDSQHCLHRHFIPPPAFSGVVGNEDDRKPELMKGEGVRQEAILLHLGG